MVQDVDECGAAFYMHFFCSMSLSQLQWLKLIERYMRPLDAVKSYITKYSSSVRWLAHCDSDGFLFPMTRIQYNL